MSGCGNGCDSMSARTTPRPAVGSSVVKTARPATSVVATPSWPTASRASAYSSKAASGIASGLVPDAIADISADGTRPVAVVTTAAYVVFGRSGAPCRGSTVIMLGAPNGPPSAS